MSGRKGRSGRKPMTVAEHVLRGSYRPERHGPLPDRVAAFPPSTLPSPLRDWVPTSAQRRSLGRVGRSFLDERLRNYACTPAEGDLLLRACHALDDADLWRRRSRRLKDAGDAVRAGRLQILHERAFLSAIAAMKESRS